MRPAQMALALAALWACIASGAADNQRTDTKTRLLDQAAIKDRLVPLRKAGLPVILKELDAWYEPVPQQNNAAPLMLKGEGALTLLDETRAAFTFIGEKAIRAPHEPLDAETVVLLQCFVRENAEALALFHQAANRSDARYPVDIMMGLDAMMPHCRAVRDGGYALLVEALVAGWDGDVRKAACGVEEGIALAETLRHEPLLISQLVRGQGHRMAVASLERLLAYEPLPVKSMHALDTRLQGIDLMQGFLRSMCGERVTMVSVFDDLDRGKFGEILSEGALRALILSGYDMETDLVTGLDLHAEWERIARLHGRERLLCAEKQASHVKQVLSPEGKSVSEMRIVTGQMLPAYDAAISSILRTQSLLHNARCALSIERYALMHGKFPVTLEDLVPEFLRIIPLDPFDGKPLRYKRLDKGYVVYCVGANLKDDNGKRDNDMTGDGDIVVEVRRSTSKSANNKDQLIECQAILKKVEEDALEVLYDHGGDWFDITTFLIESPREFKGRELKVLTQRHQSDSPWRAIGKRFTFSIQRKFLAKVPPGEGDSVDIYRAGEGNLIGLKIVE